MDLIMYLPLRVRILLMKVSPFPWLCHNLDFGVVTLGHRTPCTTSGVDKFAKAEG